MIHEFGSAQNQKKFQRALQALCIDRDVSEVLYRNGLIGLPYVYTV
jgi:hypothetical protein